VGIRLKVVAEGSALKVIKSILLHGFKEKLLGNTAQNVIETTGAGGCGRIVILFKI